MLHLNIPNKIKKCLTLGLIPAALISANLSEAKPKSYNRYDDWVIDPKTNKICGGYYQEPTYPYLNQTSPPGGYPTKITSDTLDLVSKGTSLFQGNVVTTKGNQTIYSNQAKVTHHHESGNLQELEAIGDVTITEPGLRIDGTSAKVYVEEDKRIVQDAHYRIYQKHMHGHANQIETTQQTKMCLAQADYTTCQPKNNLWKLRAKEVHFNKETGRGEAWHAKLYVKNVPAFYWPYVNFPIDDRRQTGFLQPSISNRKSHGFTVITPFYWNLAPNYDVTFRPYWMTKRNLKLDTTFRYLTQRSQGKIRFDFLPRDTAFDKLIKQKLSSTQPHITNPNDIRLQQLRAAKSQRWAFSANHNTDITKSLKFNIDYTKLGDGNYLQDFSTLPGAITKGSSLYDVKGTTALQDSRKLAVNQDAVPSQARQSTSLSHTSKFGSILGKLEQWQTLQAIDAPTSTPVFRKLPEVNYTSNAWYLNQYTFTQLNTTFTRFNRKNIASLTLPTMGNRFHARPSISHPIVQPGWFIKPRIQFDYLSNDLKLSTADRTANRPKHASRTIPMYNLDTGLVFERDLSIKQQGYIQTLEPRAYFLYVPYKNQQNFQVFDSSKGTFDYSALYRDNRYTGLDLVGDTQQVTLGVTSKLLSFDGNDELASIGVGRIYYSKKRHTHIAGEVIRRETRNLTFLDEEKKSPIAAVATLDAIPNWHMDANLIWDKNRGVIETGTLNTQYNVDNTYVLNVGYHFLRDGNLLIDENTGKVRPQRELHTSIAWKVTPTWRITGRYDYDFESGFNVRSFAGLEHHSCCTVVRFGVQRQMLPADLKLKERKFDNSIALQFVFKGFSSLGDADSGYFAKQIPGYRPSDHEF